MKFSIRQKTWLAVIVVAILTLWIIPSNVVELIARDHDVLLGRYSRQHFTVIVLLLPFSAISFYVDWSTGETYKRRWFTVLASLGMMAPLKSHVVMPAAWGRLDEHKVRAFCGLRDEELPEAESFMTQLRVAMDAQEAVVRRWCRDAGVPFVETTIPLHEAAPSGEQVYFTYDPHWTPAGHDVAAAAVARALFDHAVDPPVARSRPDSQSP